MYKQIFVVNIIVSYEHAYPTQVIVDSLRRNCCKKTLCDCKLPKFHFCYSILTVSVSVARGFHISQHI